MTGGVYKMILRLVTVLLLPHQVFTQCSVGCASCDNNRGICYQCISGYWLKYSSNCASCPYNCETCTDDFTCQTCKPQFYSDDVQKTCNLPCSSNCTSSGCAYNTGYCNECPAGWYGQKCVEPCNLCRDGLCDLRKCTNGCKDSYYQDVSKDNYYCRPCVKNECIACLNTTYCTQCNDGFYVKAYMTSHGRGEAECQPCSSDYACGDCDSILNCKTCIQVDGKLQCSACQHGYVLDKTQCIKKDQQCPTSCNSCDANNICNFDCKDGFKGINCGFTCISTNCRTCSQPDSCDSCMDGYYNKLCNSACNTNCIGDRLDTPVCRINDGNCLNGCKEGYWGEQCQERCNEHCQTDDNSLKVCYRNGTCTHGCYSGYSGPDCSKQVPTTTTSNMLTSTENIPESSNTQSFYTPKPSTVQPPSAMTSNSKMPASAIWGGVGGGVALVAIIVVIICIAQRRKRRRKENGKGVPDKMCNSFNQMQDPEIRDRNSDQQPAAQPMDYIYAQPNKPKWPSSNKDSIGHPQSNTFTSIEIDMNADKDAGEETDSEDTVKLEDLDDGETDIIFAESVAPTSDTYYNTEGLVRSRIQVSKLLNYLHDKSDFQIEFERLPKKLTRSCNEALKPHNRAKNRYNGIYSYDATRVVLGSKEYINASHIEGYNNSKAYIASLGPTKGAMPKFAVFWEMVWLENTQKIVILTNLMESGKMKCEQYWPDNGSSRQYGLVTVTAKAEHVYAEFVVRELHVVKAGESRTVTQYHYTAWPDKSVPNTVVSLLEFRDMVEKKRTPNAGPMIVHCSAGIGRTGTYIALDTLIKEGKAENSVDIFGCVNALRGQRVHMVQNVEQYVFLHHCVVYALTCQPEPLDVSFLTSYTRDENINAQFQALTNLPPLANKESDSIATNTKRKENRKGSDIPGDHHRVKLAGTKKDFINAVFVDGYLQKDRYILAQTPMPSTLEDFISLLYQEKIGLVVCLDEEDGKDKTVGQYVAPANKVSKIGHFTVSAMSCESSEDFVVRRLQISKIGQSTANDLKIQHYQFRGWKNTESVPESLQIFTSFITAVTKHCKPESGTVLVHCLDGATKSGLMCAVSIMLEKLAVERELSVINIICHVRGRRRKALQEFDQFKFCYNCVREHLETSEAKAYYNIL